MKLTLASAVKAFGIRAAEKLSNPSASGQPEDQIRAPFDQLLKDLAQLSGIPAEKVVAVGESSLSDLKTRPDYAVTVHGALTGFVELKAPGKGADPRKFKDPHDRVQWEKLRSLPNLIYSDGNSFSLWQNGELVDSVIRLVGDIETSGEGLEAPAGLAGMFENFFRWEPIAPENAKDLAHTTARLCRLLRDEVTEQLDQKSEALTGLAEDWRKLLFPEATNERFADGYAQAVTFGLLMARAKNIALADGLHHVAVELSHSSSLIGAALRLLTDNVENQNTLKTSLGTLTRVLDAVNWSKVSKNRPDAWLYFYEDFLEVYDNELRKLTGSYYTPPEVVGAMVALVDEALRSPRYGLHAGLASPSVTLADPATGTGTFILGVLRRIAETVKADEGEGAVQEAVNAAVKRLIAFEMQLGPFAVAQLRILAEIVDLSGALPTTPLRMFVTDTLDNPYDDKEYIFSLLAEIAKSRKEANRIKRDEPITVVIGNPPYKEKAKGRGGWVEEGNKNAKQPAPLEDWMPPREWGVGVHSKHLRNLYIYFWRWATWKVYDHHPGNNTGVVCFITVAGFLNGPGFQKMRDYLRRTCDDIWVIDCSPEGHQPEVNTRIFQGVQQPVCIVMVSRSAKSDPKQPAKVRFQALPKVHRLEKFKALDAIRLQSGDWIDCPTDWRAPFLPASTGAWATFPSLEELFDYNGSGVMPGRTWIIAPDEESLLRRWARLIGASASEKELLFHPHLRNGKPGDKHTQRIVPMPLAGYPSRPKSISQESADETADESPDKAAAKTSDMLPAARYGYRSFDRQWIIPDNRLINQPNPDLWRMHSNEQVYLTALSRTSPISGPAFTFTGCIPDIDHYKGSFGGRVVPLWRDGKAANLPPNLLPFLSQKLSLILAAPDLMAYIAAIACHPGYTARFREDLSTPGLRIPFTCDATLFFEALEIGRTIIWLHTFGERLAEPEKGRPAQPPRLPTARAPRIPREGAIPQAPESMPDSINYDAGKARLLIGQGYVENVTPEMWAYEVSGKRVLVQWFSYRKKNRDRPIIGDRREPSPLGKIQPDHWLAEYTTELLNVLNIIGWLVDLEPQQAELLEKICTGPLIPVEELKAAGALLIPSATKAKKQTPEGQYSLGLHTEPD